MESQGKTWAKEYASESTKPFIELFKKYRHELEPFMDSIHRAIDAGVQELRKESREESIKQDRIVANRLQELSDWVGDAAHKFKNKSADEILQSLESECQQKPAMSFGITYMLGLLGGRVIKQMKRPSQTFNRFQYH
ncbi:MAG: hypothetical protein CME62_00785 [Halobacteriovoraceae bacterium]|nr:hypothetical protein [Halobacteriovoraceae bacterium]|tara:strand:- start:2229 stop:2639 length:411 start_codon:yes stop_codon:yes gene_type:complete